MSTPPVRVGLVGYGNGGRFFHAPIITGSAGCELVAVVTRSPQRRAELARDHPDVAACDDLDALADAGVEAVAVSTPVDTHGPLVREAVQRALPVLCDKPFAPDAAQAADLVAAAERAGVPLTVYQNRRWDADFRTARALVESGALGTVQTFQTTVEQEPPAESVPTSGGGALLDLGSHLVDQALLLFGPVRSVYAERVLAPGRGDLDARFLALLRHESGVGSQVTGSFALHGPAAARFRILGSEGAYTAPADDSQADRLLAGQTPAGLGDSWGRVPEAHWGRLYRGGQQRAVPAERGDWRELYDGFAAAVRGHGPVPVDPWDAVATLRVLDAARTSATTGQVVTVR